MIKYLLTCLSLFCSLIVFSQFDQATKKTPELLGNSSDQKPTKLELEPRGGTVLWSEDFASGLNSPNGTWTTSGLTPQVWKHSFYGPSCDYQGIGPIQSPTAGNGFMIFDADSVNCAPPYSSTGGELTSPSINLTGNNNVVLKVHYALNLGELFVVEFSIDGGTNWTSYWVNDDENFGNVDEELIINPSSLIGGQGNVMVRFGASGWFNYLMIDDVEIAVAPTHEEHLTGVGYWNPASIWGNIRYTKTWLTQVQPILLYGSIYNSGTLAENSNITFDIYEDQTFLQQLTTGTVLVPSGDSLRDTVSFTPDINAEHVYSGDVALDYPDVALDHDPTNNADTILFETTAENGTGDYARDYGIYTDLGLWNGDDGGSPALATGYEICSNFEIVQSEEIVSVKVAFSQGSDPGAVVTAKIYSATSGSLVYDGTGTNIGEVQLTAGDISQSPTVTWTHLCVDTQTGQLLTLTPDEYIVCVKFEGGTQEAAAIMKGQMLVEDQTAYLQDYTDSTWYYISPTPMIRLYTDGFNNPYCAFQGVEDLSIVSNLSLYPNPASGQLHLEVDMTEAAKMGLTIYDLSGKQVLRRKETSYRAGVNQVTLDVSSLSNGVYTVKLEGEKGQRVRRLVIAK